MNGSHGPAYYQRYPKSSEIFKPSCNTNQIQDCSSDSLYNVYDNTIVNTDYVLNDIIEGLKKYQNQINIGLIYVSDHGESLGEKGVYLHGTPYVLAPKEQTHIPMMIWMSNDFYKEKKIQLSCLRKKGNESAVSHDNLFHTILGMMSVETKEYHKKLDILKDCQGL
ncbi:sulfatase-like hydrolase/transferase [Neisseriaceae bacterium PsAf]|nr:sulfatase-like hydrolase/transferase [Neisseriaceae bacterium PsAf]